MTRREIEFIARDRLADWAAKLAAEHATPLVLLGVGHDHASGRWVLCTLEEEGGLTDRRLIAALRSVADELERDARVERR